MYSKRQASRGSQTIFKVPSLYIRVSVARLSVVLHSSLRSYISARAHQPSSTRVISSPFECGLQSIRRSYASLRAPATTPCRNNYRTVPPPTCGGQPQLLIDLTRHRSADFKSAMVPYADSGDPIFRKVQGGARNLDGIQSVALQRGVPSGSSPFLAKKVSIFHSQKRVHRPVCPRDVSPHLSGLGLQSAARVRPSQDTSGTPYLRKFASRGSTFAGYPHDPCFATPPLPGNQ